MKTIAVLIGILVLSALSARAEDWKTTDGKSYQNVKVLSHDEGYVTILDADGGARVPLSTLPPDLQKRFNYDPAKAAATIAATTASDKLERAEQRVAETSAQNSPAPVKAQSLPPYPGNVLPTPPPSVHVIDTHAPANTPPVNVLGNEVQIEKDLAELDSLDQDFHRAKRDATQEDAYANTGDMHVDDTGSLHPNRVGASGDARMATIEKRREELRTEIASLKEQNKNATAADK